MAESPVMRSYLTANKDPRTGLYKPANPLNRSVTLYKPQPYEPKEWTDPLKVKVKKYEYKPPSFEYKPYKPKPFTMEYKPYELPDLDPLTGKPYRRRKKEKEEPKEVPKVRAVPKKLHNPRISAERLKQIQWNLNF